MVVDLFKNRSLNYVSKIQKSKSFCCRCCSFSRKLGWFGVKMNTLVSILDTNLIVSNKDLTAKPSKTLIWATGFLRFCDCVTTKRDPKSEKKKEREKKRKLRSFFKSSLGIVENSQVKQQLEIGGEWSFAGLFISLPFNSRVLRGA